MSFALRDYQIELIERIRAVLRTARSVCVQAPTGSGKTALSAFMLGRIAEKRRLAYFIVHRQELIDQSAATFDAVGIEYGIVAAGYTPSPFTPVQICSIDTLKSRLKRAPMQPPDLVIWDECHHVAAGGWSRVHEAFASAKHVGLSATPERLDGKGLGRWFDCLVIGPSVRWHIENGWLADYRVFAPSTPDVSAVHTRMGDFMREEAEALMNTGIVTGDAISHYRRLSPGARAVVFCVSVRHSQSVAAQFKAAGFAAAHIDGQTPREERKRLVAAFRSGDIRVLCNVELFGEGFDLPGIETAVLLRPTKSLALYMQQVGRALRPSEGKVRALILDHAGNVLRHGLPDDERQWSLSGHEHTGRGKTAEEPKVGIRQCPDCYCVHRAQIDKCPACGHVYERAGRVPEQIDGELTEVNREALAALRARMREQGSARSLEALIQLGYHRGYRNPERWAAHVWTARQAKMRDLFRRQAEKCRAQQAVGK